MLTDSKRRTGGNRVSDPMHGDYGVLEAVDQIRELADQFNVRELVYDPWRWL